MNAIEGSGSFPFRFYLSISARRVACIYLQLSIAHISPHQIKWKKKSRNKTGLCVSVLSLRKRVASQLRRAFYLLFGSNGSNQHQTRFHSILFSSLISFVLPCAIVFLCSGFFVTLSVKRLYENCCNGERVRCALYIIFFFHRFLCQLPKEEWRNAVRRTHSPPRSQRKGQ